MTEQHDSAKDYQTRGMQELTDFTTGADKQREQAAVNKLLELSKQAPQQQPKYANRLTAEMMKSVDR